MGANMFSYPMVVFLLGCGSYLQFYGCKNFNRPGVPALAGLSLAGGAICWVIAGGLFLHIVGLIK